MQGDRLYEEIDLLIQRCRKHKKLTYTLFEVNRCVNNWIGYVPDIRSQGYRDYWQAPVETVMLGTGDCEDYHLLEFDILDQLGIESSLILFRNLIPKRDGHAVLAVRGEYYPCILADPVPCRYILDNAYQGHEKPGPKPYTLTRYSQYPYEIDHIYDYEGVKYMIDLRMREIARRSMT